METTLLTGFLALLLASTPGRPVRAAIARAALGGVGGLVAGIIVTLGVVVARARFEETYLHSSGELLGWHALPVLAGPAVGIALGLAGKGPLVRSGAAAGAGLALGAALGVGIAALASPEPEWRWAGGVMGAAAGVIAGAAVGALASRGGAEGERARQEVRIPR